MKRLLSIFAFASIIILFAACEDDETDIGSALQDPGTLYCGTRDTISGDDIIAVTVYDDSLTTSGDTSAMIGHYSDETFGTVRSTLFAQLSLDGKDGINFSEEEGYTIDSVEIALTVDEVFPSRERCQLHFAIHQLAEALNPDTTYYAFQSVGKGMVLLDSVVTYDKNDGNTIRLLLNGNIIPLLNRYHESQAAFQQYVKGICIELLDDSDPVMLTLSLANVATRLTAHYTYHDRATGSSHNATENFIIGLQNKAAKATHFCNYTHLYSQTLAPLADKSVTELNGEELLYLEPLGGTYLKINIDGFVKRFHKEHPTAAINYAELLLPVAEGADDAQPGQIIAYKQYSNGYNMIISDYNVLTNPYAYKGYDGTYHATEGYYRLRVSQYMQELLRDNADYGMLLYINGRRSTAKRTILNGTKSQNPIKIAFIYNEM